MEEITNGDFEDEELKRKRIEEHGGAGMGRVVEKALLGPEPYEYEGCSPWSMVIIKGVVGQFFCMNCKHRYQHTFGCAQGTCGTLDRIEHRLWKVEG